LVEAEFLSKTLAAKEKSKLYCFCYDKLFTLASYEKSINYAFPNGVKPCENMINDIIKWNGYSIGVSIMIPVLNAILVIVLRCNLQY